MRAENGDANETARRLGLMVVEGGEEEGDERQRKKDQPRARATERVLGSQQDSSSTNLHTPLGCQ
jgi:hypothetical protein